MADAPIGITFAPTADAAANGPRQAGIEGQGGSDLAQAFKILNLHLPRLLGAASIAPKRLLTSQGSEGVSAPGAPGAPEGGFNPYSAVFESLLQSLSGSGPAGGGRGDVGASLASLFGGDLNPSYGSQQSSSLSGGLPAPKFLPGDVGREAGDIFNAPAQDLPRDGEVTPTPAPAASPSYIGSQWAPDPRERSTRYL